jgi:hypothetical protein
MESPYYRFLCLVGLGLGSNRWPRDISDNDFHCLWCATAFFDRLYDLQPVQLLYLYTHLCADCPVVAIVVVFTETCPQFQIVSQLSVECNQV